MSEASRRYERGQPSLHQSGRLHALDALRGMAAFSVLFWHYSGDFGTRPLAWLLVPFYHSGGFAVAFFFVLSGYVLMHVYGQPQRRGHLTANIWMRMARFLPLQWGTVLLVAALQQVIIARTGHSFVYSFNDWWDFFLNLLLLQQSGLQRGFSFNAPSWSISVEIWTNILLFALLWWRARPRLLLWLLLVVPLATLLWVGGDILYSSTPTPLDRLLIYGTACFFGGALLYLYLPPPRRTYCWADLLFFGTAALALLGMALRPAWPHARVDLFLTLLAAPTLIYASQAGPWARRFLGVRPLQFLGRISFSRYMMHFSVLCLFWLAAQAVHIDFTSPLVLVGFCAAAVWVGDLTSRWVEWPCYRALTRHTRRTLAGTAALQPAREGLQP